MESAEVFFGRSTHVYRPKRNADAGLAVCARVRRLAAARGR